MLAGPSGSGKTRFLVRAFELGLFYPKPTRIVWVYGESQQDHLRLDALTDQGRLPSIEYLKNETNYESLKEGFDPNDTNLLVLDDQMNEAKSNSRHFDNIFTKGSHHRNITVVLLLQNVFEKGFKTISENMHYVFLFKNPRDQTQAEMVGRQMFPRTDSFVRDSFADATEEPYTYLLFDVHPTTPKELRVLANVTAKHVTIYAPLKFNELKS
jgi:hypothetical protein